VRRSEARTDSIVLQERAAQNQALFREVNERLGEITGTLNATLARAEWVCECANTGCSEPLEMSLDEYQALRQHGARFAVACDPKHVFAEVERVIERTDRYWVVEKIERAARVAVELDPRRA
jgi:hypothetical protein